MRCRRWCYGETKIRAFIIGFRQGADWRDVDIVGIVAAVGANGVEFFCAQGIPSDSPIEGVCQPVDRVESIDVMGFVPAFGGVGDRVVGEEVDKGVPFPASGRKEDVLLQQD